MKLSTKNLLRVWLFANTVLWPVSINIGSIHLGLNILIIGLIFFTWILSKKQINKFSLYFTVIIGALFILSAVVAYIGPCNDKYDKLLTSIPVLLVLIFFGIMLGRNSCACDWERLDIAAIFALVFAFCGFVVEIKYPSLFPDQEKYRDFLSFSGIFSEPSAVAFSLFPAIAVLLNSQSSYSKKIGIFSLLGLLFISRSSTLIGLIIAWVVYRLIFYRNRSLIIYIYLLTLFGVCFIFVDFDGYLAPFFERVTGIFSEDNTTNLSSMVYLQGVQDSYLNLLRTNGLGLGVNMMGCNPLPDAPMRDLITAGMGLNLNSEDGSFLASKIISEIGVFGVILYLCAIMIWLNLERFKKAAVSNDISDALRIQNALIFLFLASSFIRSTGYFSGSFLLFVVALSASLTMRRKYI